MGRSLGLAASGTMNCDARGILNAMRFYTGALLHRGLATQSSQAGERIPQMHKNSRRLECTGKRVTDAVRDETELCLEATLNIF